MYTFFYAIHSSRKTGMQADMQTSRLNAYTGRIKDEDIGENTNSK
jgi:hypothetical protein